MVYIFNRSNKQCQQFLIYLQIYTRLARTQHRHDKLYQLYTLKAHTYAVNVNVSQKGQDLLPIPSPRVEQGALTTCWRIDRYATGSFTIWIWFM
jgi:hypothetical protein